MKSEELMIPYDRMKEQVEKELYAFIEIIPSQESLSLPVFSYEKGTCRISFPIPFLNEQVLFGFLMLMKQYITNVRVHSLDEGYYAFQAMNSNLFKTENMLDNFKIEFFSLSSSSRSEISKKGNLSQEEVNLVIALYKRAHSILTEDPRLRLSKLGASVIEENSSLDWDYIAGYEEVKRKIRESIILPLKNPDMYDSIARMTRKVYESNRPRAILFEGPPGVGKTTVARIISGEVSVPLIYVPIESIMSKWYGESSRNLSRIFDACEDLGGAIIFLDEIDSLVGSRDQNMFEATRRVLSVLLRRLDGIDSVETTLTIGATNRSGDLDHALINRFDQTIQFPLPNSPERASIFANYARHLKEEECSVLGERSDGLSGRTIKDICEFAERRWVRKLLVKKLDPAPPIFDYYRQSIRIWKSSTS